MPIWKRKRVQFIQPSDELLDWARNSPSKPVFVLRQTGEIFTDYKYRHFTHLFVYHSSPSRSYSARLSFYRTKHFQCEVTGKGGLDYFQAIESELQEARNLQARFPESLKKAVLRAVQWRPCLSTVSLMTHLIRLGLYYRNNRPS
jgi:bromodomain adjacent to zinc finger domain protein 1A